MTKKTNTLAAAALLAPTMMLVGVGCSEYRDVNPTLTPAYTLQQHNIEVARNWDMEAKMLHEDIDHILLTRPVSQLTYWNVRKMSP